MPYYFCIVEISDVVAAIEISKRNEFRRDFSNNKHRSNLMTQDNHPDTNAVTDSFELLIEKYKAAQELITQMHEVPSNLSKSGKVCQRCVLSVAVSAAILLRKIADTGYNKLLDKCTDVMFPELVESDDLPSEEELTESVH